MAAGTAPRHPRADAEPFAPRAAPNPSMSEPNRASPRVEVSARAREALLGFVAADAKARHVRIHVGRG